MEPWEKGKILLFNYRAATDFLQETGALLTSLRDLAFRGVAGLWIGILSLFRLINKSSPFICFLTTKHAKFEYFKTTWTPPFCFLDLSVLPD